MSKARSALANLAIGMQNFLSRTITHVSVMLPERGRLQALTAWGNGGVVEHAPPPMATPALS